jgi:hypothetical protein
MASFTFNDGVSTVIASGPAFAPNFPALTGDVVIDTLNALRATRLAVALAGPKLSYTVHGHSYLWTQYQEMLSGQIMAVLRERAMDQPFEEIGMGV